MLVGRILEEYLKFCKILYLAGILSMREILALN